MVKTNLTRRLCLSAFALAVTMPPLSAAQVPPKRPKTTSRPAPTPTKPAKEVITLVMTADAACTITIDGVSAGTLEESDTRRFEVTAGEHIVTAVARDGGAKWQGTVRARAGEQSALSIPLRANAPKVTPPAPVPQVSSSILVSTDAASVVFVDGKQIGTFAANEARSVSVGPGEHLVRATSQEEDVSAQETVKVGTGQALASLSLAARVAEARRLRQPPAVSGRWSGGFTDRGDTWQFELTLSGDGSSGEARWTRRLGDTGETWRGSGTVSASFAPGRQISMTIKGKEDTFYRGKLSQSFPTTWLITGSVAADDRSIDGDIKSVTAWGAGRLQLRRF